MTALAAELRNVARLQRRSWRGNDTVSTTVLMSEAYLRLRGQGGGWSSRAHFMAVASRAMRQILIDYARRRSAVRRGGGLERITLDRVDDLVPGYASLDEYAERLTLLDSCLRRLEGEEPRYCRIVECRFFSGMTIEETAEALGISPATVKRGWALAKAWLHREMASNERVAARGREPRAGKTT